MKSKKLKVYDLYCNGDKIGESLWWHEMQEMIREYKRYYLEMGHSPKFEWKEV